MSAEPSITTRSVASTSATLAFSVSKVLRSTLIAPSLLMRGSSDEPSATGPPRSIFSIFADNNWGCSLKIKLTTRAPATRMTESELYEIFLIRILMD